MRSAVLAVLLLGGCAKMPSAPPPPHFQALGTEPFWDLEVLPGQLRYASPEVLDGKAFAASASRQGNAYSFTGKLDGKAVVLTIEPGQCSDGMSDTIYPYKAAFTWGDRTEQGCARLR